MVPTQRRFVGDPRRCSCRYARTHPMRRQLCRHSTPLYELLMNDHKKMTTPLAAFKCPGPSLQAPTHVCIHACPHPTPHQHVWQICPRPLANLPHRHRPKIPIIRHQAPVLVICAACVHSAQQPLHAPSSLMASSSALVHPRDAPSASEAAITSMPKPKAPPRTRSPSCPPMLLGVHRLVSWTWVMMPHD